MFVSVRDLAWGAGLAAGCHSSFLCSRSGLRICDCLLLLQPNQQQLPPGRPHGFRHQLHDLSPGLARHLHGPRLPSQEHCPGVCCRVSAWAGCNYFDSVNPNSINLCPREKTLIFLSCRNVSKMSELAASGTAPHWWPWFNMSNPRSVELKDYQEWYTLYGSSLGSNITNCDVEREMNKVCVCTSEIS